MVLKLDDSIPSPIDPCVYLRNDCILLVYGDDFINTTKKNTPVATRCNYKSKARAFDPEVHEASEINGRRAHKELSSHEQVLCKDIGGPERRHN